MNAGKFDRKLANLLLVSGTDKKDLAKYLGVSVVEVNRWLGGVSAPDIYQFQTIARFFGMPYDWFLDTGSDFPSSDELAAELGLSTDTVEELLMLAEAAPEDVLDELDNAIYSIVSALNAMEDAVE